MDCFGADFGVFFLCAGKKFNFFVAGAQGVGAGNGVLVKKNFGGMENGCIFALAFDGKESG